VRLIEFCRAAVVVVALAGCGTTVVNSEPAPLPLQEVVDAPIPATTNEQLVEMVELTSGLGQLIADGDEQDAFARINQLWATAAPTVEDLEPKVGREIVHQLELIQRGVDRNRPADTDKASRNLGVVVDDYLAKHP
jgi:hypothetical protein